MWVGRRGTHIGLLDIQKIIGIVTEEKAGPPRGLLNQAHPLPNGWITSKQSAFFLSFFHFNLSLSGLRAGNLLCCSCPKQRVSGSFRMGWPGPCRDSVTLEALTRGELSLEDTLGNRSSSLNNQGSFRRARRLKYFSSGVCRTRFASWIGQMHGMHHLLPSSRVRGG